MSENKENKLTVKEYSRIYLKQFISKRFSEIRDDDIQVNKRLAIFLPLYIAINKRVGNFYNPVIYRNVPRYLKMLNKELDDDITLIKFFDSYGSYKDIKKEKEMVSEDLNKELYSLYVKHKLTTYKLNKTFNVNLKLASEIKNNKPITSANLYKVKLISKIKNYYE